MRLKLLCSIVTFFILLSSPAQKPKFNSINSGGLILSRNGSYGLIQSVNGLSFQKWFGGLGGGYDFYYYSSIPLFIDARRYLDGKNKSFVYADLGYNFPGKFKPRSEVSFYTTYKFSGGLYSDVGIGYEFLLAGNTSLVISGGFSYKNLSNRVGIVNPCLTPPCPESVNDYTYDFNRIIFKAGIKL